METPHYQLDLSKLDEVSQSKTKIQLHYHGKVSPYFTDAYLSIHLNPLERTPVWLSLDENICLDGPPHSEPVTCSTDELVRLLDRVLHRSPKSTGLDSYWAGVYQTRYDFWRAAVMAPKSLHILLDEAQSGVVC